MPGGLPPVDLKPRRRLSRRERQDRDWRRRRSDRLLDTLTWQLVGARRRAGLTQQQVAERMRTTRSAISRLESGLGPRPRLTTIESYALVVGCRVEIVIRRGP